MRYFKYRLIFFLFINLLIINTSYAEEFEVHITRGKIEAFPIAIPTLFGDQHAQEMTEIIKADLHRSGIFRLLDPRAFIQTSDSLKAGPRFSDWRLINAKALVTGHVVHDAQGQLRISYQLFDVYLDRETDRFEQVFTSKDLRKVAHTISDRIYERIIGIPGYFNTRIAYIAESGDPKNRQKRLALMDQDGFNQEFLTRAETGMVVNPRFCPTRPEITYMAYRNRQARIYVMDLKTGHERPLGNFANMTFAPRYSLDGNKLIMSYSENGNSDIYLMDLKTRQNKRLTANSSINTSPSLSPDGSKVVFNSDRGGTQQLYVMNEDGSDQKRISFGNGTYATPVWSPLGDLIAFTIRCNDQFFIGVMRPDGSNERILTKGDYMVEGPEWAPNGRLLTYYRQSRRDRQGKAQVNLYTIHVSGEHEQWLRTTTDASDPSWSPLIR